MADLNKSFQLKVLADITAYQQELMKLPSVTEKQAAAAALRLERELVKAAAAAGKAAQAAAEGGAKALEKGLGQAKEQAALVAAGVSKISPELGAAINVGQALVGTLKGAVGALGPIGIAFAAVGAAVTAAAAGFSKWNDAINDTAELNAQITNQILKEELGLVGKLDAAAKAVELNEQSAQARRMTATQRFFMAVNNLTDGHVALQTISVVRLAALWRDEEQASADLAERLSIQAKGYADLAREEKDASAASKTFLDSEKETAKWLAEQADLEADRIAKGKKAVEDKRRAERQAHADYMDELDDQREGEKALRKDQQRIEKEQAEAAKQRLDDIEKAAETQMDFEARMFDLVMADREKEKQLDEDKARNAIEAAQNIASATTGVAAAIFGDMKELAYAETVINTAAAVAYALMNPPGPPFSTVNAIAAGAMGAAQLAKIASTNIAHSGLAFDPSAGSRQAMAPDEMPWKLRKNEGVLTERGVRGLGGYNQVRRLNAGQSPSMGSSFVGITQFKHKMLDATIGPNIARPAAARTEIKAIAASGGRVGHRLRSNT